MAVVPGEVRVSHRGLSDYKFWNTPLNSLHRLRRLPLQIRHDPIDRRGGVFKKLLEARANLVDALKLVLECQRDLSEKNLSPDAMREVIELADA